MASFGFFCVSPISSNPGWYSPLSSFKKLVVSSWIASLVFLVCGSKTQEALNYDKDKSKEKQNKTDNTWRLSAISSHGGFLCYPGIDHKCYHGLLTLFCFFSCYLFLSSSLSVQRSLFQRLSSFILTAQHLWKRWIIHSFIFFSATRRRIWSINQNVI